MPGESQVVEANPDPIGLKVGIIYDTIRETQELQFHRFSCKNDSVLTITMTDGTDIDYYGEGTNLQAKGKLREHDVEPFNMAAETLNRELAQDNGGGRIEQAALAATAGVKNIIKKVKDGTENAVETAVKVVTGKDSKVMDSSRHSNLTSTNIPPPSPSPSFEDISQLTDETYSAVGAGNSAHGGLFGSNWNPTSTGSKFGSHVNQTPPRFVGSQPSKPNSNPAGPSTAVPAGSGKFHPFPSAFQGTGISSGIASNTNQPSTTSSGPSAASKIFGGFASSMSANNQSNPPPPPASNGPPSVAGSSQSAFVNNIATSLAVSRTSNQTAVLGAEQGSSSTNRAMNYLNSLDERRSAAVGANKGSNNNYSSSGTSNPSGRNPPSRLEEGDLIAMEVAVSGNKGRKGDENNMGSGLTAEERFAQELVRKRKEQKWEEEIRRIRREREEAAKNPPSAATSTTTATMATTAVGSSGGGGGCYACVIS